MESWRKVWRDGFAPGISVEGLTALRDALITDDTRLVQGSTTIPPPLMCVQDWPLEACDAITFTGWMDVWTVGEAEEHFARLCFEADERLGEPAACRWFLNWFDDTPRDEMRRELLAEVALASRVPAISMKQAITRVQAAQRTAYIMKAYYFFGSDPAALGGTYKVTVEAASPEEAKSLVQSHMIECGRPDLISDMEDAYVSNHPILQSTLDTE